MSLLPLLLVLCAASPEGALTAGPPEGTLVYEGLFIPSADPSTYTFTTYAPGDKPFLAVDEANLRGSASIDAPVVRTLRLGSQVEVLEAVSEAILVKDRVDRWYRVRTPGAEPQEGFVLGNVLTPLAATSDLDGDGKEESLAVSFTSDFVVRVRVLEPELAARRKRAVAALDFLLPEAEAGKRGGRARLVRVSEQEQGVALSARAFGLELCAADCVVHAVTYAAAKGALGVLSVPPELRAGVRLYPRPRKLFSLRLESYSRGPEEDVPCHVIAQVRSGPYRQEDVLSCVITQPGKSEPDARYASYFLMEPGKQ
ncbi:MAG TPA: SH3 domain-containing protein, partial [Archangium sp.]|nr:SH3 domain-containing protein [Archangium sp.]